MITYKDLVHEHKLFGIDKGDPWGSNLTVLFGVAAELFHREPALVPDELEYSPGMAADPREPEDYFYELLQECSTPDLQKFAMLLNRYDRLLRQAGRDY